VKPKGYFKNKILSSKIIFPILLFIFINILLFQTIGYPYKARILPQIIGIITNILLLWEIFAEFFKGDRFSTKSEKMLNKKKLLRNFIISIFAFIILMFLFGQLISVLIFLFVVPFLIGYKFKKIVNVIIITILMFALINFLFINFLEVQFKSGILF